MRLIAILLLSTLVAGAVLAQETDSVHQYLIAGSKAFNANDFATSKVAYQNALRLQPTNVEAIRNLGLIANTLGDLKTAMNYFQDALKYDSTDPSLYNNIGVVMSARGQTAQAIASFEKAIKLDTTNNLQLHTNLAGEYLNTARYADAARELRKPVDADTTRPEPPFMMGRAMLGLQKNDSAIYYFDLAVLRGNNTAELYYLRGVAEMNLGAFDAAGKSFAAAVLRDGKYKEATLSLGIVRVKQTRYDDALKLFKRCVELDSTYMSGWVSLGAIYMVTGQPAPADSIYRKLSAIDSTLGFRMIDLYNLEHAKQLKKAEQEKKPGKK